jgi:hypothetical protein
VPSALSGRIVVAVLGALASALSGYVSQTRIRSQEAASKNLRGYFDQPLEFSRYLIAERLLGNLPSDKCAEGILSILRGIARADGLPMAQYLFDARCEAGAADKC